MNGKQQKSHCNAVLKGLERHYQKQPCIIYCKLGMCARALKITQNFPKVPPWLPFSLRHPEDPLSLSLHNSYSTPLSSRPSFILQAPIQIHFIDPTGCCLDKPCSILDADYSGQSIIKIINSSNNFLKICCAQSSLYGFLMTWLAWIIMLKDFPPEMSGV